MELGNFHFQKNAEQKTQDFPNYGGNRNGEGYQSGYKYNTALLSKAELTATKH